MYRNENESYDITDIVVEKALKILLAIFRHPELSRLLAFKGGTSLMI